VSLVRNSIVNPLRPPSVAEKGGLSSNKGDVATSSEPFAAIVGHSREAKEWTPSGTGGTPRSTDSTEAKKIQIQTEFRHSQIKGKTVGESFSLWVKEKINGIQRAFDRIHGPKTVKNLSQQMLSAEIHHVHSELKATLASPQKTFKLMKDLIDKSGLNFNESNRALKLVKELIYPGKDARNQDVILDDVRKLVNDSKSLAGAVVIVDGVEDGTGEKAKLFASIKTLADQGKGLNQVEKAGILQQLNILTQNQKNREYLESRLGLQDKIMLEDMKILLSNPADKENIIKESYTHTAKLLASCTSKKELEHYKTMLVEIELSIDPVHARMLSLLYKRFEDTAFADESNLNTMLQEVGSPKTDSVTALRHYTKLKGRVTDEILANDIKPKIDSMYTSDSIQQKSLSEQLLEIELGARGVKVNIHKNAQSKGSMAISTSVTGAIEKTQDVATTSSGRGAAANGQKSGRRHKLVSTKLTLEEKRVVSGQIDQLFKDNKDYLNSRLGLAVRIRLDNARLLLCSNQKEKDKVAFESYQHIVGLLCSCQDVRELEQYKTILDSIHHLDRAYLEMISVLYKSFEQHFQSDNKNVSLNPHVYVNSYSFAKIDDKAQAIRCAYEVLSSPANTTSSFVNKANKIIIDSFKVNYQPYLIPDKSLMLDENNNIVGSNIDGTVIREPIPLNIDPKKAASGGSKYLYARAKAPAQMAVLYSVTKENILAAGVGQTTGDTIASGLAYKKSGLYMVDMGDGTTKYYQVTREVERDGEGKLVIERKESIQLENGLTRTIYIPRRKVIELQKSDVNQKDVDINDFLIAVLAKQNKKQDGAPAIVSETELAGTDGIFKNYEITHLRSSVGLKEKVDMAGKVPGLSPEIAQIIRQKKLDTLLIQNKRRRGEFVGIDAGTTLIALNKPFNSLAPFRLSIEHSEVLNEMGIINCDPKPDNMGLGEDGIVREFDFDGMCYPEKEEGVTNSFKTAEYSDFDLVTDPKYSHDLSAQIKNEKNCRLRTYIAVTHGIVPPIPVNIFFSAKAKKERLTRLFNGKP